MPFAKHKLFSGFLKNEDFVANGDRYPKLWHLLFVTIAVIVMAVSPGLAQGKKKKMAPSTPAPTRVEVVRETVFVKSPFPLVSSSKTNSVSNSMLRPAEQSFGGAAGFYAAEVLGTNIHGNLNWEWYPFNGTPIFFGAKTGVGTVQSSFSQSLINGVFFENNLLIALEALAYYSVGEANHLPGGASGLYPYFGFGLLALYQGSVPNVGAILAYGHRFQAPFFKKNRDKWALVLSIEDHIYSQKIRTDPSITQNVLLTFGLQLYR